MRRLLSDISKIRSRSSIVTLLSLVVMTIYVYAGHHSVMAGFLAVEAGAEPLLLAYTHAYQFGAAFVLLLVVPALFWRLWLKRDLASCGVALGDWRFGFKLLGIGVVILAPFLWMGAGDPAMQAEYPLAKIAGVSMATFVVWELCYLVYYIAWEFHFRGFLQSGLEEEQGAVPAILLQTVASTLMHIGKPWVETSSAIVAGVAFGAITLRTRSILYVLLLHWYIGMATDLFCLIRAS